MIFPQRNIVRFTTHDGYALYLAEFNKNARPQERTVKYTDYPKYAMIFTEAEFERLIKPNFNPVAMAIMGFLSVELLTIEEAEAMEVVDC